MCILDLLLVYRWYRPALIPSTQSKPRCDRGNSILPHPAQILNYYLEQLALYDIVNAPGVAVDLSHISTPSKVEGFLPPDGGLEKALTGANVIVIPAGIPRKPGVSSHPYRK